MGDIQIPLLELEMGLRSSQSNSVIWELPYCNLFFALYIKLKTKLSKKNNDLIYNEFHMYIINNDLMMKVINIRRNSYEHAVAPSFFSAKSFECPVFRWKSSSRCPASSSVPGQTLSASTVPSTPVARAVPGTWRWRCLQRCHNGM